jgi:4-alpha-glucanotransferase
MPDLRTRASGVLLHASSLPGGHGIGDLGEEARRFAESLASARQSWWQMLPVGPTGFGNSPYSALSSFAGNPLLVSLDRLLERGLLDTIPSRDWPLDRVPYPEVEEFKAAELRKAFARFESRADPAAEGEFEEYCLANDDWLTDYCLYRALKDRHRGSPWTEWDEGVRLGREAAIGDALETLAPELRYHAFVQHQFDRQWADLRAHCRRLGVGLIGDIPFYVPLDSADVWAHQDQFDLGRRGRPMRVAGVPPDDFSKEGQLWGFPLYRWEAMRGRGYDWWLSRLRHTFARFDAVRIDHFIGFHRVWAVPARLRNALKGRWVQGPGPEILERLRKETGPLQLVAEDLGLMTPEVAAMRDRFDLPGIRVLQFGFGWDPAQTHLPHSFPKRSLAATGTHDNDTSRGWFEKIDHPGTREWVQRYLRTDGREIEWVMIQAVMGSPADTAVFPAQDLLGLGSEGRMNRPGVATGNWEWRMSPGALAPAFLERLRALTEQSGRAPKM